MLEINADPTGTLIKKIQISESVLIQNSYPVKIAKNLHCNLKHIQSDAFYRSLKVKGSKLLPLRGNMCLMYHYYILYYVCSKVYYPAPIDFNYKFNIKFTKPTTIRLK